MRKKQDPISLPKRIVLGASLILASTYTVATKRLIIMQ